MTTPPLINVSMCTVVGTFIAADGTPMIGSVSFTPNVNPAILDADTNSIIKPTPVTATLDSHGTISISLIATDDPDLNPWNWTYTVSESLHTSTTATLYGNNYAIKAPSNATVNLATVIPVADFTGTPIVRGPVGPQGPPGNGGGGGGTNYDGGVQF